MPVMVLAVPKPAWNNVVFQAAMYGLECEPDSHNDEPVTIVEVTGSVEKLQQLLNKTRSRGPEVPQLMQVLGSVPIQDW